MTTDPYYSPTEEEIADKARAYRRKFSNRFVPMGVHLDALEKLTALEAQVQTLREALEQMESPVAFSEVEAVLDLPMNMATFINYVDFANRLLTRRVTINRERAALVAPEPEP